MSLRIEPTKDGSYEVTTTHSHVVRLDKGSAEGVLDEFRTKRVRRLSQSEVWELVSTIERVAGPAPRCVQALQGAAEEQRAAQTPKQIGMDRPG